MRGQILDFNAEKIKRDSRPLATGSLSADLCNPNMTMDECFTNNKEINGLLKAVNRIIDKTPYVSIS